MHIHACLQVVALQRGADVPAANFDFRPPSFSGPEEDGEDLARYMPAALIMICESAMIIGCRLIGGNYEVYSQECNANMYCFRLAC